MAINISLSTVFYHWSSLCLAHEILDPHQGDRQRCSVRRLEFFKQPAISSGEVRKDHGDFELTDNRLLSGIQLEGSCCYGQSACCGWDGKGMLLKSSWWYSHGDVQSNVEIIQADHIHHLVSFWARQRLRDCTVKAGFSSLNLKTEDPLCAHPLICIALAFVAFCRSSSAAKNKSHWPSPLAEVGSP